MKTVDKYFEVVFRVDQAVALVKILEDDVLAMITETEDEGGAITEQEALTLRGLRSQLNVELRARSQAIGNNEMCDTSSFESKGGTEHPQASCNEPLGEDSNAENDENEADS